MSFAYRIVLLTAILPFLSACASHSQAGQGHVRSEPRADGAHPEYRTAKQCSEAGGWWTKIADEQEVCVVSLTDGGNACKDDGECQSFCRAPLDAVPGGRAAGVCAAELDRRCDHLHVKDGKAFRLCVE